MVLKRIHVNQHVIKRNKLSGERNPPLTVKDYKSNKYGHEVLIKKQGVVVGKVIYRPDNPLPCGAHCWIETEEDVEILVQDCCK